MSCVSLYEILRELASEFHARNLRDFLVQVQVIREITGFCRRSVFSTTVLLTIKTAPGCFRASVTSPVVTWMSISTHCLHTWPVVMVTVTWPRTTYAPSCFATSATPSLTRITTRKCVMWNSCGTWWKTASKSSTAAARSRWILSCSGQKMKQIQQANNYGNHSGVVYISLKSLG